MKTGLQIALVALLAGGCVHSSRFRNDPRAAVVGPDYLAYIAEYPMDRATQYYYPAFTIAGLTNWADPLAGMQGTVPAEIRRLLTTVPPMSPSVQAIEGKGWPELERKGMPLFLTKQD